MASPALTAGPVQEPVVVVLFGQLILVGLSDNRGRCCACLYEAGDTGEYDAHRKGAMEPTEVWVRDMLEARGDKDGVDRSHGEHVEQLEDGIRLKDGPVPHPSQGSCRLRPESPRRPSAPCLHSVPRGGRQPTAEAEEHQTEDRGCESGSESHEWTCTVYSCLSSATLCRIRYSPSHRTGSLGLHSQRCSHLLLLLEQRRHSFQQHRHHGRVQVPPITPKLHNQRLLSALPCAGLRPPS